MWFNKKETDKEEIAPKGNKGDVFLGGVEVQPSKQSLILEHEERISVLEMKLHELRTLLLEKSAITGATRVNRFGRNLKRTSLISQ